MIKASFHSIKILTKIAVVSRDWDIFVTDMTCPLLVYHGLWDLGLEKQTNNLNGDLMGE